VPLRKPKSVYAKRKQLFITASREVHVPSGVTHEWQNAIGRDRNLEKVYAAIFRDKLHSCEIRNTLEPLFHRETQLRWFGHVIRMPRESLARRVLSMSQFRLQADHYQNILPSKLKNFSRFYGIFYSSQRTTHPADMSAYILDVSISVSLSF